MSRVNIPLAVVFVYYCLFMCHPFDIKHRSDDWFVDSIAADPAFSLLITPGITTGWSKETLTDVEFNAAIICICFLFVILATF